MDRHEPTFGKPLDVGDLQLRRPSATSYRSEAARTDISWKIAAGIFLGLTAFALVTCSAVMITGSAAIKEQERQERAAAEQLRQTLSDPDPLGIHAREAERQRREAAYYALRPGERCIDGKRFRRVDNGWEQLSRPCR